MYANYYETGASEWRQTRSIDVTDNIRALCKDIPIDTVIEIGAGEGAVLQRLSDLNFAKEFYAVEISPSGVATIGSRKIERLKECTIFDGFEIPYEDKRFDLAILSHVIEHVEYPRILLNEARRIARYVFVQVPLEDSFRRPRDFVLDGVGHINFYSPRTIRWLIQSSHLSVLGQRITNRSKAFYVYHQGKKGLLKFYIKEILLRLSPTLATKVWTYNSALLCRDAET